MNKAEIKKLMLEDLAKSGIPEADAKELRVKALSANEVKSITSDKFSKIAYSIPYFDLKGKPTSFQRLKLLDTRGNFGTKLIKYWQAKSTLPQLYFPPFIQWDVITDDISYEIYITEGEKKAAKACIMGIATIGLGGVWSWKSKKNNFNHLPIFDDFTWLGREVKIIFDNDLKDNMHVMQAMQALASELLVLGAKPSFIWLPSGGDKIGLDDYLVSNTLDDFYNLECEDFIVSKELWKINEEIAYINKSSAVYIIRDNKLVNKTTLVGMVYANRSFVKENKITDEKTLVNTADAWLKWAYRKEYNRLVYCPGEDNICGDNNYNVWSGWGSSPVKGEVVLWKELLDYIFTGHKDKRVWFERWCAYPIQHPGTKLYTTTLLISLQTGTGKSLIGETLGKIYGSNFAEIGEDSLHGDFNEWSKEKQFILANEISGSDRRKDSDRIKALITRESVSINEKFQPRYSLADCMNYLFTSNHADAMYIEAFDRRFFVHEILGDPLPDSFYAKYDKWYRSKEGTAALFYHLQNVVNCTSFNPKQKAPYSSDKKAMIDLSASDLDLWCRSLVDDPSHILRKNGASITRDLWTLEELINLIDPDNIKRITNIALSKALRRVNVRNRSIRTEEGVKRLWIIRNKNKWGTAKDTLLSSHYSGNDAEYRVVAGGKPTKY